MATTLAEDSVSASASSSQRSHPTDPAASVRSLLPILFIVFIDGMGATILIPILPFYATAFGASATTIGLLLSAYAFAQIIFGPKLGRASDRFGRKPVLTVAQIGTFLSLLVLGFANSLLLVFVSRILDGITGANLSTVQSAVSDRTSNADRGKGLGLVGAASGLGFIAGPLLSVLALAVFDNDYSAPAFLAAGFSFTSIVLTTIMFRETLPPESRKTNQRKQRSSGGLSVLAAAQSSDLGPFYLFAFAVQVIFTMFTATFTLFTLNRLGFDSLSNAIFLGLFGLMLVAMQGVFVGKLIARFGEYRVLALSLVMTAVGFGTASLAPQQAVPWYSRTALIDELGQEGVAADQLALLPPEADAGIGAFIFILFGLLPGPLGYTLQLPTINTLITKRANRTDIGETLGISSAFVGAGTVVGPLLGGYLFTTFAPGTPYAVGAFLSLVLLATLLKAIPAPREI